MTQKINRKHHQLNAEGQAAGRLASAVASLLMGKGKVDYAANVDQGDFVIVSNINALKFTGKKLVNKIYYRHSGYP
ncbi:MAG: 50S ribosomal protein L13, partial [Candidatus Komeilibacteria bacterium CG_4_9_14_3_um_filter_37_5]